MTVNTRTELLSGALEILRLEGVAALTTRRLASELGVSVSLIHHHYENKQGLLEACKAALFRDAEQQVIALGQTYGGSSTCELIERLVVSLWRFARTNQALVQLVGRDAFVIGALAEPFNSFATRPLLASIVAVLASSSDLEDLSLRFRAQCICALITRYSVSREDELRSIVGPVPEPSKTFELELTKLAQEIFAR